MLVRASFKLFVVKTNLGNKLGTDFSKNCKESELSFFIYYGYFFIFSWIYSNRFYKDTWNIHFLSKRLLKLRKIVQQIENIVTNCIQKTSKEVFQSLFSENSTNIYISQVGKLFLTQKFSNRTIRFAVLAFTQIGNNLRSLFSEQFDNFHRKN